MKVLRLLFVAVMIGAAPAANADRILIGSKKFTESTILAEIAAQSMRAAGAPARHRNELGGTRVLWNALLSGEIDVYPDYTGTLLEEIFAGQPVAAQELPKALAGFGVTMIGPLGFNNTYAIGMRSDRAEALGIETLSDLVRHPALEFGFSHEFMDRGDGWPGLRRVYNLPQTDVRGLDHDLAYRALASGEIDATDLYSTDAEIEYYDLRVLRDDRQYFPDYRAVFLYRTELERRAPEAMRGLQRLTGRIGQREMSVMNARAKIDGVPAAQLAAGFLAREFGIESRVVARGWFTDLLRYTREHLVLVLISLSAAVAVSIPLGVIAARSARLGQGILAVTGVIQTIPALALLVFMIPLLGIGGPPAIVALFLYSLLPIVRNTYTGLREIPADIRDSAEALGLESFARLRLVELPMAMPMILAGIKTSAVINVGTATLGALIGAGGYGQPILTGIRLDDTGLILLGAVPAAVLALAVQGLFELAERYLAPKGLRL